MKKYVYLMITASLLSGMSPLLSSKGPLRALETAIKACDLNAVKVEFKNLKSRSEPDVLREQLEELLETAHDTLDNPPAPKDTGSQGSLLFKGIFGTILVIKIAPFALVGPLIMLSPAANSRGGSAHDGAFQIVVGAGLTALGFFAACYGIKYISEALGHATVNSNLKNARAVVDYLENKLSDELANIAP